MAAWGDYDIKASRQLNAYVLLVEWYVLSGGCHMLWCHCYPNRGNRMDLRPRAPESVALILASCDRSATSGGLHALRSAGPNDWTADQAAFPWTA